MYKGDIFMELNVKNFIEKEIKLPKNSALIPLYEAISNSIFSNAKKIEIIIEHENLPVLLGNEKKENKIKNIVIKDDGMGFTNENYKSFNKAYESNKKSGKGKGRFFFLKAFKNCQIESYYEENGKKYLRKFEFSATDLGVRELEHKEIKENNIKTGTILKLLNLKENCSMLHDTYKLSTSILSYFLLEFSKNENLEITLKDDEDTVFPLREEYNNKIKSNIKKNSFSIKHINFDILYVFMEEIGILNKSKIILTAEKRAVKEEKLEDFEKIFANKIKDKLIYCYVLSDYLDEYVNVDRDDFEIEDNFKITAKIKEKITLDEIYERVVEILKEDLKNSIKEIEEKRTEKLGKYFKDSLNLSDKIIFDKYKKEMLKEISGTENTSVLEKIFDKKRREIRKKAQNEIKNINFEKEDYKERVKLIKEKIDTNLYVALADYVVQRKAILDLYSSLLKGKAKYKEKKTGSRKEFEYELESEIHNLLFPMKATNETVDYQNHNLWLIDESLAFQSFIASDLELKRFTKFSEDEDRPDLLFFSEYDPDEYLDSVTLIELKRPEVDTQQREESPHEQVMKYVKKLRNRELDLDGKTVNTNENTRFYCYILLDLNKKNEELFIDNNYTPLREHKGYIYYHSSYKMYVTVLDYRQLQKDAERRNKVFFDKLGL